MPYPTKENYIKFLFELLEKFELNQEKQKGPGRPPVYKNRILICFFAIMQLKHCTAFCAMHRWLLHHQKEAKQFGFYKIPSRQTLSRRYKTLYEVIQQFVLFIGQWASPLGEEFSIEVVYEDKSLFKAKGPVWHFKDMESIFLKDYGIWIQMQPGPKALIMVGSLAMDYIPQLHKTDFPLRLK